MLFDLKGRRKRAIQVSYLVLAVLFGAGLVLFGVGSGVNGGLVDAITGGSNSSGSSAFKDEKNRAERLTRVNPKNKKAWLDLARANYNTAISGSDYDRNTGQFKSGATSDLQQAVSAWERYLGLHPRKPDAGTASLMVLSYANLIRFGVGGSALDLFTNAATTQRVVAKQRPSPVAFFQLAAIYYAIGKIPQGDKAAAKSKALTPKDQRNAVDTQLKTARKQGVQAKKQLKKSEQQAAKAAKQARKTGQDPFGAAPGQSPLGQTGAP